MKSPVKKNIVVLQIQICAFSTIMKLELSWYRKGNTFYCYFIFLLYPYSLE